MNPFYITSESDGQSESQASITYLADGGFLVTWAAPDDGSSGTDIYARRYAYDGITPVASPYGINDDFSIFRINTTTAGDQVAPSVAARPDGGWSIVWEGDATGGSDIFAQRYSFDGSKIGTQFRVNVTTAGDQVEPLVVLNSDASSATYGWTSLNSAGTAASLIGRVYDLTGAPQSGEEVVAAPVAGTLAKGTSMVSLDGTGYLALAGVVTTVPGSPDAPPDDSAAVVKVVDSQGNTVADTLVLEGGTLEDALADASVKSEAPAVTYISGGGFVAFWTETSTAAGTSQVYMQAFDVTGQPDGSRMLVAENANEVATTTLIDGTIAVAWHVSDGATGGIKAQWLLADGTALSQPFDALPFIANFADVRAPQLAPTIDGGFMVVGEVWQNFATEPMALQATVVGPDDILDNLTVIGGTDSADTLSGGTGAEELQGGGGADSLSAGGGDDVLDGGLGNDTMAGGTGDDVYWVDSLLDSLIESGGEGIDSVWLQLLNSFTLPENFENLEYKGTGDFSGTGNDVGNMLTSAGGNDSLGGGGGNDTLDGGLGGDTLDGGDGSDLVDGGGGIDYAQYTGNPDDFDITIIDLGPAGGGFTLNGATAEDIVALADKQGRVDRMIHVEKVKFIGTTTTVADLTATLASARTVRADRYVSDENGSGALTGGTANEVLDGLEGNDSLVSGAGNDALFGREGADTLDGGAGNDTLDGGAGSDMLTGGVGDDIYIVDSDDGTDQIVELATGGKADAVSTRLTSFSLANVANVEVLAYFGEEDFSGTGNTLNNLLDGSTGNDTLDGGTGNDILRGGDGDDSLTGGAGGDRMEGGLGDDTYVVDSALDVVVEAASAGTDTIRTTLGAYSIATRATVENLAYAGSGNFAGIGNAGANSITGGAGRDLLSGGAGADTLDGAAGNDTLAGAAGDDRLLASAGDDVFDGGTEADTLDLSTLGWNLADKGKGTGFTVTRPDAATIVLTDGETGQKFTLRNIENFMFSDDAAVTRDDLIANTTSAFNDTVAGADAVDDSIDGGAGNDSLSGGSGKDTLLGGLGNDTLDGGAGDDSLVGGAGNDYYVVDVSADAVVELAAGGTDTVTTALTSLTLATQVENLSYGGVLSFTGTGNESGNVIASGDGNDTLSGAAGNDTLKGGFGDDSLVGGAGNDRMEGGAGDDIYVADRAPGLAGDSIVEAVGAGTDTVQTALAAYDLGLAANVEVLVYTGTAKFAGKGNVLANTITGGNDNDVLSGLGGADSLDGGAGNDTLAGGDGADTLIGGAGSDRIDGGAGVGVTDVARVSGFWSSYQVQLLAGDIVQLKAGDVTDLLIGIEEVHFDNSTTDTGDDTVMAVNAESGGLLENIATYRNDTLSGAAAADSIDGGAGNDSISGGAANDTLAGGIGNDTLVGGLGDDSLVGGAGRDVYVIDSASDAVVETAASTAATEYDVVRSSLLDTTLGTNVEELQLLISGATGRGNDAANVLTGYEAGTNGAVVTENDGVQTLYGMGGNDKLYGGTGDDTLDGGVGTDSMYGGAGADIYYVGSATDVVVETLASTDATESDTVFATSSFAIGANIETLLLGAGAVSGTGGSGDNTLLGDRADATGAALGSGGTANVLNGGLGNDTLDGGLGKDSLTGGGGADHFEFSTALDAAANVDRIIDMAAGTDKIALDNDIFTVLAVAASLTEGFLAFGTAAADADDYLIYDRASGQLWYDADGSGSSIQVLFAIVANKPWLSATDFYVME